MAADSWLAPTTRQRYETLRRRFAELRKRAGDKWADRPDERAELLHQLDDLQARFQGRYAAASDAERPRVLDDAESALGLLEATLGIAGWFHKYGRPALVGAAAALFVHWASE